MNDQFNFITSKFEKRINIMRPDLRAFTVKAYLKLDQEERAKAEVMLEILQDKEDLRNWVRTFFKIELPSDTVDEDSNSNPLDAMWTIYKAVRDNTGDVVRGYIMLSAREAYKTLSASMLEVLILLHFQVSISHMAAIEKQSDKCVSYVNGFFNKLEPFLHANGWRKQTDSKTKIQFKTPEEKEPYLVVIVCTIAGANSEHTPIMFIDEVDVVRDPNAYEEAKFIPSQGENGRFPITVKLSTRKFAFGLMQKELDQAKEAGEEILQWNIMDITEKCFPERYKPDSEGKTTTVYAAKKLPLKYLSKEDYDSLPQQDKPEYQSINAHPGCLSCKLLSVCKTQLAQKPENSIRNLYRPISGTIGSFARVTPDKGEAQLMCWRPSTKGLVYPRFDQQKNAVTIDSAFSMLTGENVSGSNMQEFVNLLKRLDSKIYAGIDWGYTHEATIVVMAVTKVGYSFILETFGAPQLEVEAEFLPKAVEIDDKYSIDKWFCDTAAPANIKTWRKRFRTHKVPDFKKDVLGGIEAIRGQIVDSGNMRRLLVLKDIDPKTGEDRCQNAKLLTGFKVHHFILDNAGNPTTIPDDEEFADVMDALRYIGQNVFATKVGGKILVSGEEKSKPLIPDQKIPTIPMNQAHAQQILTEISNRATQRIENVEENNKNSKKIVWDF
jgi:hypothetical protein